MNGKFFVDTNVLVYSRDESEPQKKALELKIVNPFVVSPKSLAEADSD